jgi:hypothetical protein
MNGTSLRQQATLAAFDAESTVEVTALKAKANTLGQRRKYRTKELRIAGHNCSRERPAILVLGFKMWEETGIRALHRNCASEHSLCSPWRRQ